jgi:ribosomal protein S12 methylthiotransferase accessory factor
MMPGLHPFGQKYAVPKGYREGTHRTRRPQETLDAYLPFMPALGITRLANVTGLDTIGLPVYMAIRPNARSLSTSQGKGLDAASAKASALMEALEFWHAEFIDLPLRWDSYQHLRTMAPVADVSALPLRKGAKFRSDHPCLWIEGFDLLQSRSAWVPHEVVSLNFVNPEGYRPVFYGGSTGLASGNHILEAVVHGLCEAIERDAMTLWEISDSMRQVDLSTVKAPLCVEVLSILERAGVHAVAWNLTSDVGVPVYSALIIDTPDYPNRWRQQAVYTGYGCHLSPAVALLRALTEAAQARLTTIVGSRDDMLRRTYRNITDNSRLQEIWEEISHPPTVEDFVVQTSLATDSFEDDLATLLDRLRTVGIEEVIAVDLTREEFGVPVVKVIVPGLEDWGANLQLGVRAHRILSGPRG